MPGRLAVIPWDPLDAYAAKGIAGRLEGTYNPCGAADEVWLFSPLETVRRQAYGMNVLPTKDIDLPQRIREHHIDLVRAYGGGWPADMACYYRVSGVPVVVSIHDKRPETIFPSVKRADHVIALSVEIRDLLVRRGVKADRINVIPNGVDLELMTPDVPDDGGEFNRRFPCRYRLLTVGRRSPEKNLESVIKALALLGPDYGLISVGPGDAAPYRRLAEECGVAARCFFEDALPQPALARWYAKADALVNPSFSEAMSNALVEAMACGALVVTTATAGRGVEAVDNDNALLLSDPTDVRTLAELVRRGCTDPALRGRIREQALRHVKKFALETVRCQEGDLYSAVLERRRRGGYQLSSLDKASLVVENSIRRLSRFLKKREERA